MKNLILSVFLIISTISFSQEKVFTDSPGALIINVQMPINSFQVKHMEEEQYNQMSPRNIDSSYVVMYYEEYQAYDIALNQEYFLTFKIDGGTGYKILVEEDIQMICSCKYELIHVGKAEILKITF